MAHWIKYAAEVVSLLVGAYEAYDSGVRVVVVA